MNLGENKIMETDEQEILGFFEKEPNGNKSAILKNALGSFKTDYIYDSKEFIIREYSCTYATNYTLKYTTKESGLIQISFFLNQMVLKDQINTITNEYLPYHNYIYFTPKDVAVEIYFKKEIEYRNLDIYVAEDYFHHLINTSNESFELFISSINQKKFTRLFDEGFPISPQMMSALTEIKKYPNEGICKEYYIKSRIMTILQLLFESAESKKTIDADKKHNSIKEYEINKIHEIKDFIDQNLTEFYTIENLASRFETNDFKIKKGFKALFNTGIFEYSTKMRMKHAQNILKTTDLSIKEIAYQIGYGSPSSFSTAFKKECLVSPNVYRAKRKNSLSI